MLLLYHSLINSHLQYCISNWCFGNSTLINKLQLICNKFLKMTFDLPLHSHIKNTMIEHNILRIDQLFKFEIALLMFKKLKGCNSTVHSYNLHTNPCKYNTRNKAKYVTHHCKTTTAQQSFSFQGLLIWNALPSDLKNTKNLLNGLKNISKTFYYFKTITKLFCLKE